MRCCPSNLQTVPLCMCVPQRINARLESDKCKNPWHAVQEGKTHDRERREKHLVSFVPLSFLFLGQRGSLILNTITAAYQQP